MNNYSELTTVELYAILADTYQSIGNIVTSMNAGTISEQDYQNDVAALRAREDRLRGVLQERGESASEIKAFEQEWLHVWHVEHNIA